MLADCKEYDVRQRIGKGSFGDVYLVIHKATNRRCGSCWRARKTLGTRARSLHIPELHTRAAMLARRQGAPCAGTVDVLAG